MARRGEAPIHIALPGPLVEARFVERPNRFLLRCALPGERSRAAGRVRERNVDGSGEVVDVHMADPGRLTELLLPDRRVWIRYAAAPSRKTDWSAVLVESPDGEGLVSVDTTLPNRLIHRALAARALDELEGWTLERAEFPLGRSRIDFLLRRDASGSHGPTGERPAGSAPAAGERKLALEVKSVTLVEDGVALFPDAVTARGARHVRELAEVAGSVDEAGNGWEAAILFVLQRPDAERIEAARSIDPEFAAALAEAEAAGVRVLGRRCRVTVDRIELAEPVPAR
jgi:sugar fermentation stimulation protein A